jgi:hypothetical protein
MTRLLFAAAILALSLPAIAQTQQERCYPGPPLFILRELLGGQFTPQRYSDAIVEYAHAKCSNGQTLKLVSPSGPDDQDKLNEEVALRLCDQETIYRERLAAGEGALVLFCLISKLDK